MRIHQGDTEAQRTVCSAVSSDGSGLGFRRHSNQFSVPQLSVLSKILPRLSENGILSKRRPFLWE